MPVFRVNVYARSTKAVNYRNRGGSTTVDLKGTNRMPKITGRAKVDGKAGRLAIDADLNHMDRPATKLGGQYLTYVLWAVTPEGRAVNLGEVFPRGNGKDKLTVTTDLQAFGLIVTAEPYFAVTHPSDVDCRGERGPCQNTKGFEEPIDAKFDVLEGKEYTIDVPADQLPSAQAASQVPLDLLEARNAVAIAKAAGAEQYAASSLAKAKDMLQRAEDYLPAQAGTHSNRHCGPWRNADGGRRPRADLAQKRSRARGGRRKAAADAQAKAQAMPRRASRCPAGAGSGRRRCPSKG